MRRRNLGSRQYQGLSVFLMSLRAQRGNLVAVAMMVPRHVLNLNEIATSLRSSHADNRMTLPAVRVRLTHRQPCGKIQV